MSSSAIANTTMMCANTTVNHVPFASDLCCFVVHSFPSDSFWKCSLAPGFWFRLRVSAIHKASRDLHRPNFPQRADQCPADWRALRCRFTVYVSHTGATAHLESTRARERERVSERRRFKVEVRGGALAKTSVAHHSRWKELPKPLFPFPFLPLLSEFVETGPCGRILLVCNLLPLIKISPFKVWSILLQPRQASRRAWHKSQKPRHDGIVCMNWWQIQVSAQWYDVILLRYDTLWNIWAKQWITTLKRC